MKRDTDLKQLWLKYITFAHFTKSYFHVNPLLKPVPGIWKRFVLVSYCCSNKLPQTWLLKPTQIYDLMVLEVRRLKWFLLAKNVSTQLPSPGGSRRDAVSWPSPAPRGHPHSLARNFFSHFQRASLQLLLPQADLILIILPLPP